tara:strand:- start:7064 stop:7330 length:267 start_codon:yes stop_codon:yes gene_type:complete
MIVVKVELHSAITGKVKTLGQMIIHNVGGTEKSGNYEVKVARKNDVGDLRKNFFTPLRTGRVQNYPRLSYNVWRLVLRSLRATFPEEK